MKKLLLLILFLYSVRAEATITKIAQVGCSSAAGANCTTGAVNGTGGNFIVIVLSDASTGTTTLSDSSSNSYAAQCGPTEQEAANATRLRIFYKAGATVSSSMTFTATATSSFPSILVGIFSGVATSSPCDQSAGTSNAVSGTTTQLGSVTPGSAGELIISGLGQDAATTSNSVNQSFVFTGTANVDFQVALGGSDYGALIGYLIQTSAAAVNPTWSWTTGVTYAGVNATFTAAATGTASNSSLMLLGVGQ